MVDFRIDVIVDPSRVPQGTRVVERQLTRVENRSNRLRASLLRTFSVFAGGAAIIGAVRSMAQFEEAIATAGAVSGATASEFERLTEAALQLGITTRFSATEAANALVNLSRAGFSVNESIEAVDDTLNLAQAGGLSLAQASDIAASSLRGFRLEVDQAGRVTDVLVAAANSANTNVQQLGEGIKFVAPIAAGLGQSLELTTAALGTLSDAGLKATLAGTGLRRVLAELESPSSASQKILAELGVTADEVRVSQVGLVDALQALKDAGVDTGQALELFGQRGGPAFEVLVNQIPRLKALNEELKNSGGTANEVSRIIDDTLNGALFRARSAIDGFVQSLGQAGASEFLIGLLDSVAAGFRLVADNADAAIAVLTSLSVLLVARVAPALFTTAAAININMVSALRSAIAALVLYRGNLVALVADTVRARVATLSLAGGFNALKAAAVAAPFLAIAAAVGVATFELNRQKKVLEDVAKAYRNLEEDANFGSVGTQIRIARQELSLLKTQIESTFENGIGASDSQLQRMEVLRQRIADLTGEARKQVAVSREVQEARARTNVTTENLIANLDREAAALQNVSRETENRARFEEELNRLLQAGQVPTAGEREQIQNRIETISLLEDQARILQEIKGPQEEFARNEEALNALLDAGKISADEFRVKLAELQSEFNTGIDTTSLTTALDTLREQNDLLDARVNQGEFVAEALRIENQLREQGIEITREVQDQIANQLVRQQQLNGVLEERNEKDREAKRLQEANAREEERLARIGQLLTARVDAQELVNQGQMRLKELLDAGAISADVYAQSLADIQLRGLEASLALEDGFARAFAKITREAEDLAEVGEKVVNAFANNATDALVKFAETGQFSFKEFASSILKDLTRIIARLLIVQALNSAFGGGIGTTAGNAVSTAGSAGARAEGGTVQPARSFIVGEEGPETFVPDRTGTIVPNQATAAAQAAPPVVQVINVQSEEEIPNMIESGTADDAILNVLQRNKDRAQQVLS